MDHLLAYALRNLGRNRRRTALTLATVAVGTAGLVFSQGYTHAMERYLRTAQVDLLLAGDLAIYPKEGLDLAQVKPWQASLGAADLEKIGATLDQQADVLSWAPVVLGTALLSDGCRSVPVNVMGLPPERLAWIWSRPEVRGWAPELVDLGPGQGLWERPEDPFPVMISGGISTLLGKHVVAKTATRPPAGFVDCEDPAAVAALGGDASVQLLGRTWAGGLAAADATISANVKTGFIAYEGSLVFAPLEAARAFFGAEGATSVIAYLRDPEQARARAPALRQTLAEAGVATTVYPWGGTDTCPNYAANEPLLRVVAAVVQSVLLLAVSLGVANAMTIALMERSPEIGALRALGARPSHLLLLVLAEAGALALLGAALGVGVGLLGALGVNRAGVRFLPPDVSGSIALRVVPQVEGVLLAVAAVLLVALIATLFAARRVGRARILSLLMEPP